MGLIQSLIATTKASNVAPTSVDNTSSDTVESQSSTEPVKAVELVKEQTAESTIVKETVAEVKAAEVKPDEVKPDEVKADEVKADENVPKTPNSSPTVPLAKQYVMPIGTKVEVAPVEVNQAVDVVKKNKNKNKNSKKD